MRLLTRETRWLVEEKVARVNLRHLILRSVALDVFAENVFAANG